MLRFGIADASKTGGLHNPYTAQCSMGKIQGSRELTVTNSRHEHLGLILCVRPYSSHHLERGGYGYAPSRKGPEAEASSHP